LVPTPNHCDDVGKERDAFVLNPAADVSPGAPARRMLHFLGQLMGVCLRRGDVLPLCLSRTVWKAVLGEEMTVEDLECFDAGAAKIVRRLGRPPPEGVDADTFAIEFSGLRFVVRDSAGQERELMERGRSTRVTFERAKEFADLMLGMRLQEAKSQLEHLRSGLARVVSLDCLALWTWRYLEERVCGIAIVDVGLLKKYVRYDGIAAESPEVGFLWEVIEEMCQNDLRLFLHFVWGRSRLPPDGSPKWAEGFKVTSSSSGEQWLPTAHTCFFQLDLPAYTSKEVCKQRVQFAIHNCVSLGIA